MNLFKYLPTVALFIIFSGAFLGVSAQDKGVTFTSSDKGLEQAFNWAKKTALHYQGNPNDAVGPWYEASLPQRNAFCMRDVSHQCIGAEILGMSRENANMFNLFARNISAQKNWCSYWEINKYGKPAPEDYRNDREFWYNLPANFDVLNATWQLYLWTGDTHYINDKAFVTFQEKTLKNYIDSWVLAEDSLLTRPAHPNAPVPFNKVDAFHSSRGLPSYLEGVPDMKTGVDLIAALYCAHITYANILIHKGHKQAAAKYLQKARRYQQRLEADWWDETDGRYNTYYTNTGKFGRDEGETLLLWFDALKDTVRLKKAVEHLASINLNVENVSYLPYQFYKYNYWDKAKNYILFLANPSTKRREYPEVSFGVIEGIVQGLMGVTPDARNRVISTGFKSDSGGYATITHLPVLNTTINLTHSGRQQSTIANTGQQPFKWQATFYGTYRHAYRNGKPCLLHQGKGERQKQICYVATSVNPGEKVTIKVEN